MSIHSEWKQTIEDHAKDAADQAAFWSDYCEKEKGIYEDLLGKKDTHVEGTVAAFADKYQLSQQEILGFLDGISDSLTNEPPVLDEVTADSPFVLDIDFEKLYWNMVAVPAEWLYNLPQWDAILPEEKRHEIYMKCKKRNTVVNDHKVGRNDPCPCGSGKKYKKCCGR